MTTMSVICDTPPAPASDAKRLDAGVASALLAMVLATAAGALALLWIVEGPYYRKWLGEEGIGGMAGLLVNWTIWSKSMLLMLPVLGVAALCLLLRRRRLAWGIWAGCGAVVAAVICLDAYIYDAYGRHLVALLGFAAEPQALRWAGGIGRWIVPVATPALAAAAVLAALAWGTHRLTRSAGRRHQAGGLMLVGLLIPVPATMQYYVSGGLFDRTRDLMPFNVHFSQQAAGRGMLDDPALHALDAMVREPLNDMLPQVLRPAPLDREAVFTATPQSPNVILLVLESFNWDIDGYELMPKLQARARGGLRGMRHYSGGNHSDVGLYSILYGQPGLCYEPTLNLPVVPQMVHSFAASGYQTRYFSSAEPEWMMMERYLRAFDSRQIVADRGDVEGDLEVMRLLTRAVQERGEKPLFAMTFLMSTHMPFSSPSHYQTISQPVPEAKRAAADRAAEQAEAYADYLRAARFLDDQIDGFLEGIDLSRNIVVICGDHGESLYDDGVLSHYSRLSDAQSRTPLIVLGAGIPRREIVTATSHTDLLPTLLHAAAGRPVPTPTAYGQDLLAEQVRERHLLIATVVPEVPVMLALIQPRDDQRLLFNVDVASRDLRLFSFAGADGAAGVTRGHSPAQIQAWAAAMKAQFETLRRISGGGDRR